MSDTVVNDPAAGGAPANTTEFFLDGNAPRLGDASAVTPPPSERLDAIAPSAPTIPAPLADAPTLPVVSPVLSSPVTPQLPNPTTAAEQAAAPQLPNPTTAAEQAADQAATPAEQTAAPTEAEHPMAHLMPSKTMPSEASRRAAELRAARKAKSKKIKIGVISGMLVVTAIVGPPLGKWLVDAINEAGNTSSVEQPAE